MSGFQPAIEPAAGRQEPTPSRTVVLAVAFRPDGKVLASVGRDQAIWLWSVEAAAEMRLLEGAGITIASLAYNPEEQYLDGQVLAAEVVGWARGRDCTAAVSPPSPSRITETS